MYKFSSFLSEGMLHYVHGMSLEVIQRGMFHSRQTNNIRKQARTFREQNNNNINRLTLQLECQQNTPQLRHIK